MIFDSLGLGELGIVLVLGILLLDPKRLGSVLRQVAQFRKKVTQIQNQVRTQMNTLVLEDEIREKHKSPSEMQATLRQWSKDQIRNLTAEERHSKGVTLTNAILAWDVFQNATSLCAFVGKHDEIDTQTLIEAALKAGKIVYLPYVAHQREANQPVASNLEFCAIRDFHRDLSEGELGILEPKAHLRLAQGNPNGLTDIADGGNPEALVKAMTQQALHADLTLVPGLCFDAFGGRIGRGKGYYDRHLALAHTYTLALAFEAQVHAKKLPLAAHDITLDALVTESRFLLFNEPGMRLKA
jgi:5-formyltetrahydrofolate cyclo-ligase